ncbi:hypothetical protein HanPI659440_Chr03g0095041 [Helianthus annuus]|nr:hypothetical protein HanPI659440_Chr03g0095041 [Helianthus annuus]
MFFANAVLWAGQILIEEEEEDVSSENIITRRIRINRDRQAHETLVNDYFSDEPLYNDEIFRCRFRMSRRLVTRIANDLAGLDPFFTQRPDARNYEGFTTLQKYCGHSPTGVRDSGRRFGRVLTNVGKNYAGMLVSVLP